MPDVILALDVGDARIGLARGEVGSPFAFGRGYITRRKLNHDVAALQEVVQQEGAAYLVVGLPKRSDGTDSKQTVKVRSFAKELEKRDFRVVLEDERFTTRIATQGITESGLPKMKRQSKGRVDEASAVLILESYLARLASQNKIR